MSELKRRLEKLEAERIRVDEPQRRKFPVLVFSRIGGEPEPEHVAGWLAGYESEKAQRDSGAGDHRAFRYYGSTITAKTCDGRPVSMAAHEYYLLAKEGRRIERLSAELLKDWLDRQGFKSW